MAPQLIALRQRGRSTGARNAG